MSAPAAKIGGVREAAFEDLTGFAEGLFERLRAATAEGDGISRPSYGEGESKAIEIVADAARAEGLEVAIDRSASLVMTLAGREAEAPYVACGSHLDSVPNGGNFDGAGGVIAALLALVHMKRAGIVPPRTIKALSVRGEESAWFGISHLGAKALFGKLGPRELAAKHRDNGRPLAEYLAEAGVDMAAVQAGEPLVDAAEMAAFVELHIEQGPVMVARKLPVAVVTGIRGAVRHQRIMCRGQAGHSGAVPRWLRHDAMFALGELIARLDEHWRVLLERGLDLVVTVGMCGTDPTHHALTRIPGEVGFSLDIRSEDIGTLESFYRLVQAECDAVGHARGVAFEFDERSANEPARMDERWVRHLDETCDDLGIEHCLMASGAGHDASVFANSGVPTVMIFVRNEHGSHNPREAMEIDDFMAGAKLLCHAVRSPAL